LFNQTKNNDLIKAQSHTIKNLTLALPPPFSLFLSVTKWTNCNVHWRNSLQQIYYKHGCTVLDGPRGSIVGWGTMLQAGKSRVRFPMRSLDFFFNLPNHSSRTIALKSTQPLTEMSTRNFPGRKGRPALKADKLTKFLVFHKIMPHSPHILF
jgi:hypothetical protein